MIYIAYTAYHCKFFAGFFGFLGSNSPLQSNIQHFAEQRNAKSTSVLSGWFRCRKRKTDSGTADIAISKPVLSHFMKFWPYFAVKSEKKRRLPWQTRGVLFGARYRTLHGRTQYATGILLPNTPRRWLASSEADFESYLMAKQNSHP